MIARTSAVIHPGGVLGALHCEPPLTLRRVAADDPATCALCLVGTAAGPLAGDHLALDLRIEAGASAELRATGASIAQGRGGGAAALRCAAVLGDGARLRADPGPLVVCEGSRVDVAIDIALGRDASLEWRELVVLGRSTDAGPGAATIRWDVTRAGRPLLRQHVELSAPVWPGLTGGHRVLASALITGPEVEARTVVASRTAVAQRLEEHSVLVTVLGDSAAEATQELADLLHQLVDHQSALA
ncbi:MAG: urease accessory protein [Pseudonocardiales bacterium]|jgi:urease accessory protein|nr:urease accessory protein [Pseudonocardiales bacterium]